MKSYPNLSALVIVAILITACESARPPSELLVEEDAPWKQRFRAPVVLYTHLAKTDPTRRLAVSNKSGVYQLYAWDVPSGELRQLTHRPEGQLTGHMSADGRYVYYLHDQKGNEIGHFVRVPFEGGEPEDITPEMPEYPSFSFEVCQSGTVLGFTRGIPEGFELFMMNLNKDGTFGKPRMLWQAKSLAWGPVLSYEGEIAVMASTEQASLKHYRLVALDVPSGNQIGELWDGPESSVEPVAFVRRRGDFRLLATTNKAGVKRPVIWTPRTGERTDLALDQLEGEVLPLDWSPDGERVLLMQFQRAVQQLFVYDLGEAKLTKLNHPPGTLGRAVRPLWRQGLQHAAGRCQLHGDLDPRLPDHCGRWNDALALLDSCHPRLLQLRLLPWWGGNRLDAGCGVCRLCRRWSAGERQHEQLRP